MDGLSSPCTSDTLQAGGLGSGSRPGPRELTLLLSPGDPPTELGARQASQHRLIRARIQAGAVLPDFRAGLGYVLPAAKDPAPTPPGPAAPRPHSRLQHCEEGVGLCSLWQLAALLSAQPDDVTEGLGSIGLPLERQGSQDKSRQSQPAAQSGRPRCLVL